MTDSVTENGPRKWEYTTLIRLTEPALLRELNAAGQEGWELTNVLHYKDIKGKASWIGFLKRPCTGQPSQPAAEPTAAAVAEVQPPTEADETPGGTLGFDLSEGDFEFKDEPAPEPVAEVQEPAKDDETADDAEVLDLSDEDFKFKDE